MSEKFFHTDAATATVYLVAQQDAHLIEFGVGEPQRERAQRGPGMPADQRGDHRGIQPAAQVGAHRHVGTKLQADGIDQQRVQFLGDVVLASAGHILRQMTPLPN